MSLFGSWSQKLKLRTELTSVVFGLFCIAMLLLFSGSQYQAKALDQEFLITDPKILMPLEDEGAEFGRQLGSELAEASTNKNLVNNPIYRSLVDQIRGDLLTEKKQLQVAPPSAARHATFFSFDWLLSPHAHFELIGVVNRMDRIIFPTTKACGEARLIYRLAYATTVRGRQEASRLPMTIALIFDVPENKTNHNCMKISEKSLFTKPLRFRNLEINLQSSRWPAFESSNFAENTRYLMHVFSLNKNLRILEPLPLENTPDVPGILADSDLKQQLLAFLRKPHSLAALQRGNLQIPEKFLTKSATSVAPFGLDRQSNRLFSQIFTEKDFESLESPPSDYSQPSALLRRLDSLSCIGCHQSRSVAGFHLIGESRNKTDHFNVLAEPFSPYFRENIAWRRLLSSAARGNQLLPDLPATEKGLEEYNGYGARCGAGGSAFSNWHCREGLECNFNFPKSGSGVGQCLPPSEKISVGDPCELRLLTSQAQSVLDLLDVDSLHEKKDKVDCGVRALCSMRTAGFPNGMCATGCEYLPDHTACQRVPLLDPFSACLEKKESFQSCLDHNSIEAAVRTCGFGKDSCREDYVCAKSKKGGFCMPNYFIPQLTIENHPSLPPW